jgi:hypothetical protein
MTRVSLAVAAGFMSVVAAMPATAAVVVVNGLRSFSDPLLIVGAADQWNQIITHPQSRLVVGRNAFEQQWQLRVTTIVPQQTVQLRFALNGDISGAFGLYKAASAANSPWTRGGLVTTVTDGTNYTADLLAGDYVLYMLGQGLTNNSSHSINIRARYNSALLVPAPAPAILFAGGLMAIASAAWRRKSRAA